MPISETRRLMNGGGTGARRIKFTPPSNCVLWLPGQDDPMSTAIRDRSGNANHGTIAGAVWTRLSSGLWGLSFDGTDDTVSCGNGASLQITNNLSVEFWYKTPAAFTVGDANAFNTYEFLFSKYLTTTNNRSWQISLSYPTGLEPLDNLTIIYGDPADGTFEYRGYYATNLAVSTLYHIVLTFASGTDVLYLNGAPVTITDSGGSVPVSLFNSTAKVRIGSTDNPNLYGKGEIYLPRIYSTTVLTADQVASHFNQERHLFGV